MKGSAKPAATLGMWVMLKLTDKEGCQLAVQRPRSVVLCDEESVGHVHQENGDHAQQGAQCNPMEIHNLPQSKIHQLSCYIPRVGWNSAKCRVKNWISCWQRRNRTSVVEMGLQRIDSCQETTAAVCTAVKERGLKVGRGVNQQIWKALHYRAEDFTW